MSKARVIGFHFNKGHNENPDIPMWVVKADQVYYVHHLESHVGFSTKERPDNPTTKGLLTLKGVLEIVTKENGEVHAIIHPVDKN